MRCLGNFCPLFCILSCDGQSDWTTRRDKDKGEAQGTHSLLLFTGARDRGMVLHTGSQGKTPGGQEAEDKSKGKV